MSQHLSALTHSVASALITAALLASACKTAPAPAPGPPAIPFEQKMAWILQLEDQRILRMEAPPPAPVVVPKRGRAPQVVPAPPPVGDLVALLHDADPRVRRRAALAIGRVGLLDGIAPLTGSLTDTDPDVRQAVALGLGLIGDATAAPGLMPVLTDASPMVRGRAAEALGLIGAKDAAVAIGTLAAEYARHASVTGRAPDDEVSGRRPRKPKRSSSPSSRSSGSAPGSRLRARCSRVSGPSAGGGRLPMRCSGSGIRAPTRRCVSSYRVRASTRSPSQREGSEL